ncbi:hypothetical protein D7004_02880 [Pedobacter jejuensis]|uniref:Uncharacterized protein n=1 Tax=Pedobacter jejuensis TaxID=1268550 RepID=A0A3N0C1U1_9SPHI|nr:hypothetical protein D7004_02880 [Pedobacter jejuensis]
MPIAALLFVASLRCATGFSLQSGLLTKDCSYQWELSKSYVFIGLEPPPFVSRSSKKVLTELTQTSDLS